MRIAYYSGEGSRATGTISVKEVNSAYVYGDDMLVCDNLTFLFENKEPYKHESAKDLLLMLFKTGYLDLRSLKLIVR